MHSSQLYDSLCGCVRSLAALIQVLVCGTGDVVPQLVQSKHMALDCLPIFLSHFTALSNYSPVQSTLKVP